METTQVLITGMDFSKKADESKFTQAEIVLLKVTGTKKQDGTTYFVLEPVPPTP